MCLPLDPKTKLNLIVEASNQSLRDWIFSHLPNYFIPGLPSNNKQQIYPITAKGVCSSWSWRSLCNTGGELVPDKFHGSHRSGKNHDGSWTVFHVLRSWYGVLRTHLSFLSGTLLSTQYCLVESIYLICYVSFFPRIRATPVPVYGLLPIYFVQPTITNTLL